MIKLIAFDLDDTLLIVQSLIAQFQMLDDKTIGIWQSLIAKFTRALVTCLFYHGNIKEINKKRIYYGFH
jgi:FMN phosphatase YigB (HAD superfamily)